MMKSRFPKKTDQDVLKYLNSTKSERLEMIKQFKNLLPDNYAKNDIKEDLVLEYVEQFRQQYVHLFSTRPPLMLFPKNELGCKKFISTFIRPTELPYHALYDVKECAKFVFHFVQYEPLEKPTELPEVVVSPTTLLYWQKGDCFDISTLLVSLLIGVGYNAFCVCGYAKKHVTLNDQLVRDFPEEIPLEEPPPPPEKPKFVSNKYKLKRRPKLDSEFVKQEQEKKNKKPQPVEDNVKKPEVDQEEPDPYEGKRIHCWVAVLVGARDVEEPFFIEPSTGEIVSIKDPSYISIESMWNHENYWCNMQTTKKISEMSFNLYDLQHWEYIFIEEKTDDEETNKGKDDLDDESPEPAIESGEIDDQILDLPTTWVDKLVVTKEEYENRYPGKQKKIMYKNALLELFSEYHCEDCLVKRITLFANKERTIKKEIHCFYAHRKDLLQRRSHYYNEDGSERVHEWFAPGRRKQGAPTVEALKETIYEYGKRREFRFYHDARLDGLLSRTEIFDPNNVSHPRKVIERYKGRDDFLNYRSATYDTEKPSKNLHVEIDDFGQLKEEYDISKMTEKFDRDETKDANVDIEKRTFYPNDNVIKIKYHYGEGKITRASRTYYKNGDIKAIADVSEFKALLKAEKICLKEIKARAEEMKDICKTRGEDELKVIATTTVYDVARNRPTEQELKEMEERERELRAKRESRDYLSPYLEKIKLDENGAVTTVEDAENIFKEVLANYKKRVVHRAKIIEERLHREEQNFQERKIAFQKNQDQAEKYGDEFFQYLEDAKFKIDIIRDRLEKHKKDAKSGFARLQQQLFEDRRLKKMLLPLKKRLEENAKAKKRQDEAERLFRVN